MAVVRGGAIEYMGGGGHLSYEGQDLLLQRPVRGGANYSRVNEESAQTSDFNMHDPLW